MTDIVLIGTTHDFQRGFPSCSIQAEQEFIAFLLQCCVTHKAALVAEEMCGVHMAAKPRKDSTCLSVARSLNIPHAYCEPPVDERAALGIRDAQQIRVTAFHERWSKRRLAKEIAAAFAFRESIWLERLKLEDTWPVLFVCGANHVSSFKKLILSAGYTVRCVRRDWA